MICHAHRIAAQALRDPHKVDAGQIEARHIAHLHHLLNERIAP